ncbi:hypothetical protein OKT77_25035 [Bacillus anthracis]|uniref:hypothetical protein n=1 Tax=Bacillus anthracis TaxID=1392 RepID=UPI000AB60820|nr:hypothetical protein [Bacillus anthracis]MCX9102799.1 hypothetical protein [Bacillus anthracis]
MELNTEKFVDLTEEEILETEGGWTDSWKSGESGYLAGCALYRILNPKSKMCSGDM